jgi:hypothetical protein
VVGALFDTTGGYAASVALVGAQLVVAYVLVIALAPRSAAAAQGP